MAELLSALTCRSVITDIDTNSLNYIEVLHGLTARRLPSVLPRVMLGTVWKASKTTNEVLQVRIRVESPTGENVVSMDVPTIEFERPIQRLNIDLAGMDVREFGEYSIIVESLSRKRWRQDAKLPFAIQLATADPEETEGSD